MEIFEIKASPREVAGTTVCRGLRRDGFIPAIIYGKTTGSSSIMLDTRGFVQKASKANTSQVFMLKSEDKKLDGRRAIVKEIQRNYINGGVLHVDLLELQDDTEVRVIVPLSIVGEAPGVKTQGGILTVACHSIVVSCLPKDIPTLIEVSIAKLKIGQRIRTGDLELPEGVALRGNPKETVASIISGRASKLAADEDMDAESEEAAAEGEGAEQKESTPAE